VTPPGELAVISSENWDVQLIDKGKRFLQIFAIKNLLKNEIFISKKERRKNREKALIIFFNLALEKVQHTLEKVQHNMR